MNKQEMLSHYNKEDKLCLAKVLDKIETAITRDRIEYTDFLNMYQIDLVKDFLKKNKISNYILYGGYDDAERKVLIVYSDKYNLQMLEKNYNKILKILRITLPEEEKGKYIHRTYLGGIVKLGLKREKVGDIIVADEGADIVVLEDFSNILKDELSSLTRFQNSEIGIKDIHDIKIHEVKTELIKIIVPSLRLDNFVSDLVRTSRGKAVEIINQERVFINGQLETKLSKQIRINDIITIRGKGRFVVKELNGTTKSGRIVVIVEKFV